MPANFVLKNIAEESRLIKRRVYIAATIIVLFIPFILSRLFYLQVLQHEHFITLSQNNRIKVLPLPPTRGLIYSRDNILLAENQPAFSLEIVPERVDNLDQVVARLAGIITVQEEDR